MNSKRLVLIVEDEDGISNFISAVLTASDYSVIKAVNGKEALEQTASHSPDVVLLDLGLPDMEGLDVLRDIRVWSKCRLLLYPRASRTGKSNCASILAQMIILRNHLAHRNSSRVFEQRYDTFSQAVKNRQMTILFAFKTCILMTTADLSKWTIRKSILRRLNIKFYSC